MFSAMGNEPAGARPMGPRAMCAGGATPPCLSARGRVFSRSTALGARHLGSRRSASASLSTRTQRDGGVSMRVAVYARVSDDLQKDKQTIESQLAEVRQFAKEQDWPLDEQHIYADDG